jgi:hypothetical protein
MALMLGHEWQHIYMSQSQRVMIAPKPMIDCGAQDADWTVEKDRATLSCAPRLSRYVLSLLQFMHKENVS